MKYKCSFVLAVLTKKFLKKKYLILAVLLVGLIPGYLVNRVEASTAPPIEWQKYLGEGGFLGAYSAQQTSDGGYVVTGEAYADRNNNQSDVCVVKLNTSGGIMWQKYLGGTANDYGYSIQQTSDGGYIVAGSAHSNDGDVSGNHGGFDAWVVKLSASGEIEWQKCIGGANHEDGYSIQQTSDGEYIVAGASAGVGNIAWVVKLSASGEIKWQKYLGGSAYDYARSIQQTSDGGYIVAGSFYDGTEYYKVAKLNALGDIVWQKSLGVDKYANSIQQTSDGGYVVAGTEFTNGNGNNIFVVKLSASGDIVWQKSLGGTDVDEAYSIQQTNDGGYVVAGYTFSNDGDVSGNHGGFDAWIVKLSASGEIKWQKCIGGTGKDGAHSIQQTSDGGYIVAGYTGSNDGDVSERHSGNMWVVKLAADGGAKPDDPLAILSVHIFERGRATSNDSELLDFWKEASGLDEGIICVVPPNNPFGETLPYLDYKNNPVTEQSLSKLSKNTLETLAKVGLTADGNTRLIVRVQINQNTPVRFSIPEVLGDASGGRIESLVGRLSGPSSSYIDVTPIELEPGLYQATAVLIAPKNYPHAGLGIFPAYPFQVSISASDQNITKTEIRNLVIHPTPVVLIHGFGADEDTFRKEDLLGIESGIIPQLKKSGFKVANYTYDGMKGPTWILPLCDLTKYKSTGLYISIADVLNDHNINNIACTRVDLVTHSMGGLMARRFLQVDWGNKESFRAYKQGMVRRIVTIATPHFGSPWADYFLEDVMLSNYANLHFNAYNTTETERLIGTALKDHQLMAKDYLQEMQGEFKEAMQDLLIHDQPIVSSVPMYAIYGEIKDAVSTIDTNLLNGPIVALREVIPFPPVAKAAMKAAGYINIARPNGVNSFFNIMFGEDEHESTVSKNSASRGFEENSFSYGGNTVSAVLKYHHGALPKQDDVGGYVVDLLKGPESAFIKFPKTSAATTLQNAEIKQERRNHSFNLISKVSASTLGDVLSISTEEQTVTAPSKIEFTCTANQALNESVYLDINRIGGDGPIVKMTRGSGNTYTVTLTFDKNDVGQFKAACFSNIGDRPIHSKAVLITVKPESAGVIKLAPNGRVILGVGDQVGIGLRAEFSNGKSYNISSPLMGTSYTIANPAIVQITDEGKALGLASGATTMTATYGGLSVPINIYVTGGRDQDPVPVVIQPTSVSFADGVSSLSLNAGNEKLLTAQISPSNTTETTLSWKAGNNSLLSLVPVGTTSAIQSAKIIALAEGTTTVTVTTSNGHEATVNVTITSKKPNNPTDPENEEGGRKGSGGCDVGFGLSGLVLVLALTLVFTKLFRRKKVEMVDYPESNQPMSPEPQS